MATKKKNRTYYLSVGGKFSEGETIAALTGKLQAMLDSIVTRLMELGCEVNEVNVDVNVGSRYQTDDEETTDKAG